MAAAWGKRLVRSNDLVAGYWADLNPGNGGTVSYETTGTTPNREFVVMFDSVPHLYGAETVTFQIILHETSGDIEVMGIDCQSNGDDHAQGVENSDGSTAAAMAGRNRADFSLTGDAVLFSTP